MILVIGGTGNLGARVVGRLLDSGAQLRLLSRPTSRVPPGWDVEVVRGDLGDTVTVAAAARGCSSVFLLSAMNPDLDAAEITAIDAMGTAGAGHVVKLSTTAPAVDSPISWWRAHWRAEQALRAAPVGWTILRPNGIASFLLDFAPEVIADACFRTAAGTGAMALVHPDDVADAAAAVLAEVGAHQGRTWDLTGPRALTYDDVAVILGGILDRPIRHLSEPPEVALPRLMERGLAAWEAEGVVANWLMTGSGEGDFVRVTDDVRRICGRAPRTVEEFMRDNADVFRGGPA